MQQAQWQAQHPQRQRQPQQPRQPEQPMQPQQAATLQQEQSTAVARCHIYIYGDARGGEAGWRARRWKQTVAAHAPGARILQFVPPRSRRCMCSVASFRMLELCRSSPSSSWRPWWSSRCWSQGTHHSLEAIRAFTSSISSHGSTSSGSTWPEQQQVLREKMWAGGYEKAAFWDDMGGWGSLSAHAGARTGSRARSPVRPLTKICMPCARVWVGHDRAARVPLFSECPRASVSQTPRQWSPFAPLSLWFSLSSHNTVL